MYKKAGFSNETIVKAALGRLKKYYPRSYSSLESHMLSNLNNANSVRLVDPKAQRDVVKNIQNYFPKTNKLLGPLSGVKKLLSGKLGNIL